MMVSRSLTWAATSVPEIRRRWCNALAATVERHSEGLNPPTPGSAQAGSRRLERMQSKLAEAIAVMQAEADALRGAQLYWVARDMVEVSMGASASLPECYVTASRERQ